jgi:hypothetical protein
VVGAVHPDPAALTAHDHGLVLAEAGDVGGDGWPARTRECALLSCLDPLGQDQRVIGDVGELPENLRLIDRAGDASDPLAFFDPDRIDEKGEQLIGNLLTRVCGSVESRDRDHMPARPRLAYLREVR